MNQAAVLFIANEAPKQKTSLKKKSKWVTENDANENANLFSWQLNEPKAMREWT